MMNFTRLALCAAVAVAAESASAAILLSYGDFSNTAGLTLSGSASTVTTADGRVLRLTPASVWGSGVGRTASKVTLGADSAFSTTFQFRLTNQRGLGPGDGMTFFLAAGTTNLGVNPGGWLGYYGVPQSVAIEFDTYSNGPDVILGDQSNGNHVAVDINGAMTGAALASPYGVATCNFSAATPHTAAGCMANGHLWSVTIGYDGSLLNVYVQDGNNAVVHLIDDFAVNIGGLLATNQAYVGFTAGTYAAGENHDIVNWQFANTTELAPSAVPEPTTLALLGLGLAGLAATRRRLGRYAH